MARQPPKGRHGPKLPYARIERAVEYKMLGYKWGEIEKLLAVPHSTLMRWYALPDWKVFEEDWLAQDPLVRRAKAVLAKKLAVEFAKKDPDTALAERILAPRGNGDGDGAGAGLTAHPGVIIVPMQNRGLESRPPTQVLLQQPTPAPGPPPPESPKPKARKPAPAEKGKRRIVGPDEE